MAELGEKPAPPFPNKDKEHKEIEIKIIDIKDARGTSIKGGGTEYDPRKNAVDKDKKTTIEYEVKNQEALIFAFVRVDPGNSVAKKYYKDDVVIFFADWVEPGKHKFEWDGRSLFDGSRYIIQGDFKFEVEATCMECGKEVKDQAKIKVKKPYAHAYGPKYPSGWGNPTDLSPPAEHVRLKLKSLSDGSEFITEGSSSSTGPASLVQMHEKSAVFFWDGHARPGGITFFNSSGSKSYIASEYLPGNTVVGVSSPSVVGDIDKLPAKALNDVFLVVLLGCQTSVTPSGAKSLPVALTSKGVDLVVAFKKKVYLRSYLKWTKDFVLNLNKRKGIRKAAKIAKAKARSSDRARLAGRVFTGSGANSNDKLLPARYGRK